MIPGVAGLLAVALFSATGWLLTGFIPFVRELPGLQRWRYSYLLGVAWIGGFLYVLDLSCRAGNCLFSGGGG
ncbi:MAG TPA: hypothetical protein VH988_14525 [Thermoanaerobaculia bacterium]|jgi:hypothetical protein|nr:hypothetical protein [Thermoanaerobaculia bacterium]